jgi:hypothetical protein
MTADASPISTSKSASDSRGSAEMSDSYMISPLLSLLRLGGEQVEDGLEFVLGPNGQLLHLHAETFLLAQTTALTGSSLLMKTTNGTPSRTETPMKGISQKGNN